ncbi:IS66 family transposase [Ramlibacter sp. RBP-2]|uniref:IS66 family transposase n=1 Tax=Ramlibacter lithotrophicus TaxID=2606681 RepID=A0A7X6DFB3_9BURK|nr:IS66 family transposase [Ramlibacter lithotrophicus]
MNPGAFLGEFVATTGYHRKHAIRLLGAEPRPPTSRSSSQRYGNAVNDNNVQENAIRSFCVGRRNCPFADTVAGANASANLCSLLRTCQVNGINGYRYLRALFTAPKAQTVTSTPHSCSGALP